MQQIFPFAVEGLMGAEPADDWVTHTFVVWVELMVRAPRPPRPPPTPRPASIMDLRAKQTSAPRRWPGRCAA